MQIKNLVILFFISVLILCCHNNEKNTYYRSGIVLIDSLKLANGLSLFEGDFVQISLEKSTEEGTFVRVSNDSGIVYSSYIGTLCWLKSNLEAQSIKTRKEFELKKFNWFIFERIEENDFIVKQHENQFRINKDLIYFDNVEFYNTLLK